MLGDAGAAESAEGYSNPNRALGLTREAHLRTPGARVHVWYFPINTPSRRGTRWGHVLS